MKTLTYETLKELSNLATIPCTVLSVEKKPDGSCGEIRFFAINELFKKSYYDIFAKNEGDEAIPYEGFEKSIEGELYTSHLPKEPNFEDVCFRAAWNNEYINTYVDTTKMYGFWTEDILLPIGYEEGADVAYCTFMYTLNKEMDTGKFATVSPDIASFVIKTCVELRNEKDFLSSMNTVVNDLRIYTDSFACCVLTVEQDQKMFEIISESVRNNEVCVKEVFSTVPYSVVASWEGLVKETNCIIIKDEHDFEHYKKLAPEWARSLKDNDVHALVLYPLIHHGGIIGYLYITNFDVANILRLQETIELISFFLTAEVANHLFLQRLEYLSNVDMLTGVFNRNCMNVNVDELSLKLEFNPRPFNVAFCDLNGLKTVNDTEGHAAGDVLLKDAAKALREVFDESNIFRAGGDEFSIIISGLTEKEMERDIELIREVSKKYNKLVFAVGGCVEEKGTGVRTALRLADERMYADKKKYYDKYPERKRTNSKDNWNMT